VQQTPEGDREDWMRHRSVCTALFMAMMLAAAAEAAPPTHYDGRSTYRAPRVHAAAVQIDGVADESAWERAPWRELEHRWLGPEYTPEDFQGRFKLLWTENRLYVLAEIVDDVLIDSHRDPLVQYWDDDCLEIFIDEDDSGGDHQYNHNAFAYHMSLDNRAIDIGTDRQPRDYSHHVESRWRAEGNKIIWELAISIYTDDYEDDSADNRPQPLVAGKQMGFMVAYCDNDGSQLRENFIGSENIPGEQKDRGWIDAGVFGALVLVE
jgi:hypothetical protein